jgi:polyphenol oxidase
MHDDWITPDWPVNAAHVGAVCTTRAGGSSCAPYDTMNLGVRVADDAAAVHANRDAFARALGAEPVFLHQVHGAQVLRLDAAHASAARRYEDIAAADGAYTTERGVACTVQVADCMPVLLAAVDASVVGAAHAGWRGLAGGVVDRVLLGMCEAAGVEPSRIVAWLGPCIGARHFEVGADVLEAFADHPGHLVPAPRLDGTMRWRADLVAIARDKLRGLGVGWVGGGTWCTVTEARRFYSFRRDRQTGRHAAAVCRR